MAQRAYPRRLPAGLALAAVLLLAGGAQAQDGDLELGKQVFLEIAEPQCGLCHTLADAGTSGAIGPNLDELQPDEERVMAIVRGGSEIMPAFGDTLSDEQIEAVAHYVATVAGQQ